ncbi:phage minor head protein [Paenibacillus sp. ClWae2A]|uniref:phage minor head protein n=1 Tax=Paenibacillus sp. ClWae2A TaxID=3057177 RepID=UPI0028F56E5E|nr:phage minor head protein [Paenibacillus sp. ClWae2A]MDT9719136.1 phage minor head protein [Paenibacillus sp. ClWae2A]
MEPIDRLLTSIATIVKAEEGDITEDIPDFPGLQKVPDYVEDFESAVAKLLRGQRKYFVDGINTFVAKDETLDTIINFVMNDLFAADELAELLGIEASVFLTLTITDLVADMMFAIDKDVSFKTLSGRTTKWIKEWGEDLGKIMALNSHKAVEEALITAVDEGESVQQAVQRIKDLPQFDRERARVTAQTEILAASSRSQWEAYKQSPSVVAKRWRHSGSKNNNPREAHVKMDGDEVPVDDPFDVNGHSGDYPRDPKLPPGERIGCKCVMSPVTDKKILGLSPEEKEAIRQQVLDELED